MRLSPAMGETSVGDPRPESLVQKCEVTTALWRSRHSPASRTMAAARERLSTRVSIWRVPFRGITHLSRDGTPALARSPADGASFGRARQNVTSSPGITIGGDPFGRAGRPLKGYIRRPIIRDRTCAICRSLAGCRILCASRRIGSTTRTAAKSGACTRAIPSPFSAVFYEKGFGVCKKDLATGRRRRSLFGLRSCSAKCARRCKSQSVLLCRGIAAARLSKHKRAQMVRRAGRH